MLTFSTVIAREVPQLPALQATPKTLNEQYKDLSADCEIIGSVRMMKLYKMDQLWKSVKDSLTKKQVDISQLYASAAQKDIEIASLKTSLNKSSAEKEALQQGVDNLVVFGTQYSKVGFITVMLIVMVGLLTLAIVLFMMYRVAFGNAHEFRKTNEEMNKEYEDYKHHAVEKQIKLSRELQDYRNRMAELKSV
jgi:DNA repair exonuclease SbcCD ATPase subunit